MPPKFFVRFSMRNRWVPMIPYLSRLDITQPRDSLSRVCEHRGKLVCRQGPSHSHTRKEAFGPVDHQQYECQPEEQQAQVLKFAKALWQYDENDGPNRYAHDISRSPDDDHDHDRYRFKK